MLRCYSRGVGHLFREGYASHLRDIESPAPASVPLFNCSGNAKLSLIAYAFILANNVCTWLISGLIRPL